MAFKSSRGSASNSSVAPSSEFVSACAGPVPAMNINRTGADEFARWRHTRVAGASPAGLKCHLDLYRRGRFGQRGPETSLRDDRSGSKKRGRHAIAAGDRERLLKELLEDGFARAGRSSFVRRGG